MSHDLQAMTYEPENACLRPKMLTLNEFSVLQDVCNILEPLKELTEYLSGSRYTTSSILYPAIYSLINIELPAVQMVTSEMAELRDELIDILGRRFYYVLDERVNELYIMACFLDVRYKSSSFFAFPS